MSTHAAANQPLAIAPDAVLLHGAAEIAALSNNIVERRKRAQFAGQRPHDYDRLDALRAQTAENLDRTRGVAAQGRVRELVNVVTTAVGHRIADVFHTDRTLAEKQAQFLDFLACRQQVALDPIGDKRHDIRLRLQSRFAHAAGNPARQLAQANRPDRQS